MNVSFINPNRLFTLTDPIPILLRILIWESIGMYSIIIWIGQSGSVNAP